ncbi:hypothetical protein ACW5CM_02665 [Microbacterium sp. A588]
MPGSTNDDFDAFNADGKPTTPVDLNTEVSNELMEIKNRVCGEETPAVDQWLDSNGELTEKWQKLLNDLVSAAEARQAERL